MLLASPLTYMVPTHSKNSAAKSGCRPAVVHAVFKASVASWACHELLAYSVVEAGSSEAEAKQALTSLIIDAAPSAACVFIDSL